MVTSSLPAEFDFSLLERLTPLERARRGMAAFFMDLLTVRRLLVLRVVLRCATTSSPLCRSSTPNSGSACPARITRVERQNPSLRWCPTLPLWKKTSVGRMKASEAGRWKVKRSAKIGGLHKHVGLCGSDGLARVLLSRGDAQSTDRQPHAAMSDADCRASFQHRSPLLPQRIRLAGSGARCYRSRHIWPAGIAERQ